MNDRILIIGGGLSGLSAGCYARMNGFETHILEHAPQAGGLCTSWSRGDYLVDGCVQWLMGGAEGGGFRRVYEELGLIRDVKLEPIERYARVEDTWSGVSVDVGRDLDVMRRQLEARSPDDRHAIAQLFDAIDAVGNMHMPTEPVELSGMMDALRQVWEMRQVAPTLMRMRGTLESWADSHFRDVGVRDVLKALLLPEMPAMFLPFLLHELRNGQLSRPVGGSSRIAAAIERRYRELGGQLSTSATVDEILVKDGRAVGVRLADGSVLDGGLVISTSSAFETHQRLLGGAHGNRATQQHLKEWKTFNPIVLVSVGVDVPLRDEPSTIIQRQRTPLEIGGHASEWLMMRVFNDAPWVAPENHTVVQSIVATSYDFWARLGAAYPDEKAAAAREVIARLEQRLPAIRGAVRMVDVSTPLTFWRYARSWRGAYEGWLPTTDSFFTHVSKRVDGVTGLYLAGQWVEPGGGVPPALLSGRQVVQVIAHDCARSFSAQTPG